MQITSLFVISVGLSSFHIVCDADAANNVKHSPSQQVQNNFDDTSFVNAEECFTDDEIKRVQKTWILLVQDSPIELGEKIFSRLLDMREIYRTMFSEHSHDGEHGLLPKKLGQNQSLAVIETMNSVVDNLPHISILRDDLRRIGKFHSKIGVTKDHFMDFREAALYTFNTSAYGEFSQQDYDIWSKTLETMLKYMFEGYQNLKEALD